MNDNELDDLFRSNADYLADQPPRDFDKDAFWQQLQTAIPQTANRKKTRVWRWAAAAVLLTGMLGGIWWMKQETGGVEKIAQGTPATTSSVPDGRMLPQIPSTDKGKQESQRREQPIQQVPLRAISPENEPATVAIQEYTPPESVVEATNPLPEIMIPPTPKVPAYRVVHINEIRERKQQEAKARTRLAFRVGVPSGTRLTAQSDQEAPLSISIQN